MKHYPFLFALLLLLALGLTACGGETDGADNGASGTTEESGGLTQAQIEKGIGPIESVELSETIDESLVAQGEPIFTTKCTACHKMDERYVGPPLGDVLEHRTPEYIMNMMLNPAEMLEKHPAAKEMLAQYMTPMPNQNLTEDDARAILEYLRANQTEVASAQ